MKVFHSLDEIKQHYTPRAYRKEMMTTKTPKEIGSIIAKELLETIREALHK